MNTKRIQDAEKLVKKGEEHLKTGLFKWSPDIDSAIECFDKGYFRYRALGCFFDVVSFVQFFKGPTLARYQRDNPFVQPYGFTFDIVFGLSL